MPALLEEARRRLHPLSVEERFLQLMELQRFAEELKRAAGRPKDYEALAELEAIREERGEDR